MKTQSSVPKLKKLEKAPHAIDFVGTGTYQVGQLDILQLRSVELNRSVESNLSARGLHHRSLDFFSKGIKATTSEIQRTVLQGVRDPKSKNSNHYLKNEYFNRALGFERLGQIDKAIEDYSRCLSMDNRCAAAFFNRGGLLNTQGKLDQAIGDLTKALAIQPTNKTYLTNRALLYRRKGLFEEATHDMVLMKSLEESHGSSLKASSSASHSSSSIGSITPNGRQPKNQTAGKMTRQTSRSRLHLPTSNPGTPSPHRRRASMHRTSSGRGKSFRQGLTSEDEDDEDEALEYVMSTQKSNDPMINYLKKSYMEREESTAELRSVIDFLKSVKFFAGIASDPVIMKHVADKVKLCTYKKGDYIFQEGDPGTSFFIVADGEISVVKCILAGKAMKTG